MSHPLVGSSYSSESVSSSSVSCPLPHRLKAASSSHDQLKYMYKTCLTSKVILYLCKIKIIWASDGLMTFPAWHWYHLQCANLFFFFREGVAKGTKGSKRTFGTFFGPQLQWDNCGTWWGTSDFYCFSIVLHLGWLPNQNASRNLMTNIIEMPCRKDVNLLGFKCKSNNMTIFTWK